MIALITGFGPFGEVTDNPSGRLARAVHGARVGAWTLVGLELPVAYERAVELTVRSAHAHGAGLVLGTGVARRRTRPELERAGRTALGELPDVEGTVAPTLPGPPVVDATIAVPDWAEVLGCGISDDAGGYVCNAWLHQVAQRLAPVPVGFLHVPPHGVDPAWLLDGLGALSQTDRWRHPATRALG